MKKTIKVFVIVLVLFALAACSSKDKDDGKALDNGMQSTTGSPSDSQNDPDSSQDGTLSPTGNPSAPGNGTDQQSPGNSSDLENNLDPSQDGTLSPTGNPSVTGDGTGHQPTENDDDLLAEGFMRVDKGGQGEQAAPTLEEVIAALDTIAYSSESKESTEPTALTDDVPAIAVSWMDVSDYDDVEGHEGYEGYERPTTSAVMFDDENWPEEGGLIVADWRSELSDEELAELEQQLNYDPSQSVLLSRLPSSIPGTADSPMEAEGTLVISARGVTQEQAVTYFEACKQAGFNKDVEEMDLSSMGMGCMWIAYHADGSELTMMLNGNTLQILLSSPQ